MRRQIKLTAITLCALLLCACPSQSRIDAAAKSSRELAHDTILAEKIVKTLYESGRLSLERKDFYAAKLKLIATEGGRFNDLIVKLDAEEKAGTLPANAARLIAENFAPILSAYQDIEAQIGRETKPVADQLKSETKPLARDVAAIQKVSR